MGLLAIFHCQEERGNCISGIGFFLIAEALENFNGSGFINDSRLRFKACSWFRRLLYPASSIAVECAFKCTKLKHHGFHFSACFHYFSNIQQ